MLVACAALGLAAAVGPAETAGRPAAQRTASQAWVKRGVILEPGFAGPISSKLVSSPSVVKLGHGRLRMYFWAADGVPPWHGRHVILAAEADPGNPFAWELVSSEPMVGADTSGNIRNRGVGFPYVLAHADGPWLMYYCAWGSWAPSEEVSNRTGLAISEDQGLTWRVVRETVLPLGAPGSYDAGLTGSVSVLRAAAHRYLMWYTAGERYVRFGERNRAIVHVGAASSPDGINWTKAHEPALTAREDAVDPYEAVLGKPNVIAVDGVYHMWVSVYAMPPGGRPSAKHARYRRERDPDRAQWEKITSREPGYRIEYARSTDGVFIGNGVRASRCSA